MSCGEVTIDGSEERDELVALLKSLGADGLSGDSISSNDATELVDVGVDALRRRRGEEEEGRLAYSAKLWKGPAVVKKLGNVGWAGNGVDEEEEEDDHDHENYSFENVQWMQGELTKLCRKKDRGAFRCPLCSFSYRTVANVFRHIAIAHFRGEIARKRSKDLEKKWCSLCHKTLCQKTSVILYHFGVVHGDALKLALDAIRASSEQTAKNKSGEFSL